MSVESDHAGWQRLHPLSPVVRIWRVLLVVPPLLLQGLHRPPSSSGGVLPSLPFLVPVGIALVFGVVGGVVSWRVTCWRLTGTHLLVQTGLVRRQSIRVPLSRLQAVEIVRPFAARVLGLSELRLVLAGSGTGKAQLAYLGEKRAADVRAHLLAVAHGLAPSVGEAPERAIGSVSNGRLLTAQLLSGYGVLLLLPAAFLAAAALIDARAAAAGAFTLVSGAVTFGTLVFQRVNAEFDFTLAESPDGIRLRSGLLQTRAETIPLARIQGVRLVQPLFWRPWKWCRLEVDTAHQRSRSSAGEDRDRVLTRALLPVGSLDQATALLAVVMPGAVFAVPAGSRAPRRSLWKAPLSWHLRAAWLSGGDVPRYVATRTGRVCAKTVVVPLAKAQSIRFRQGPVQRSLGLATVSVDTAGRRWTCRAVDRSEREAADLVARLPELARAARGAALP